MIVSSRRPATLGAIAMSAIALITSASAPARAALINVTIEAPGVQTSQQPNVVTETFDALPLGSYTTINSAIGTYTASTPGGRVVGPDAYGGSFQTDYLAVGAQSNPTTSVELTLVGPRSYFGFYFAAIDALNHVQVYDGLTLLADVTSASLAPLIGGNPAYYGNPNLSNVNTGEPYVYVNVFGLGGQTFDRVVFLNDGTGTGLETDNHSIRAVPEPSSLLAAGIGLAGLLGYRSLRLSRGNRPSRAAAPARPR